MKNIFTDHPHSLGESYLKHFKFAVAFGVTMLLGGIACIIHALFPFLFQKTASDFLLKLIHNLIERTPGKEDRIIRLSLVLEKKLANSE